MDICRVTRRVVWVLAALALAVVPAGVTAQGASTSQKLESIREQMEKGQAFYVAGDYAKAASVFEEGYGKHPYSAFLFNAGVCYQKLKDYPKALEKFEKYLSVDPNAPDAEKVKERIAKLRAATAPPPTVEPVDGGLDGGDGGLEGGVAADAGARPPVVIPDDDQDAMKSLVVIETEPKGAPVKLYARTNDNAKAFVYGGENPGWESVADGRATLNLSVAVGRYHIVVEKFRDFNVSETDIDVSPGHVHHFKANLSQGAFMAFLRIAANVRGAYIYLDDTKKQKPEWGTTPYGELVPTGTHSVLVEAPGFQPLLTKVEVKSGEQKELEVKLARVDYGILRIDSNAPKISVEIDEKPMGYWRAGEAPLEVRVPAGRHKITVEGDGRKTYEGIVDVPKGQVLPVHAKMIPTYPRGAAWTQAVLSALFIGAAIYMGTESDNLHDELEADRKAGVLEQDDSRKTRGQIFAIGANAGFAVGGVLAVLATYNFIKDPLPESVTQVDEPVEFEDPKKKRPTAGLGPRRVAERKPPAYRARSRARRRPVLSVGPSIGTNVGGLVIGGSF